MADFSLHTFTVTGLNGAFSVEMAFDNNRLVLIGENGTSKSTLLTMLHLVLSRQWERLQEFEFTQLAISFSERDFRFTTQELQAHVEYVASKKGSSRIQFEIVRTLKAVGYAPDVILDSPDLFRDTFQLVRRRVSITEGRFRAGLLDILNAESTDLLAGDIPALSAFVASLDLQIIYLPTYRRIERDLKTLFPNLEEAIQEAVDALHSSTRSNLVELVEFGMEDVQDLIGEKLNSLRGTFQADVNNLFGEYLRDVLRGNYAYVTANAVQEINSQSLDAILGRLDEETLPAGDRANLRAKVEVFRTGALSTIADQVVAHFLVKLHSLQKTQLGREESLRSFVELCNSYLVGKTIEFDSVAFKVAIVLETPTSGGERSTIEFADLSSGEKQVISLFAHLAMGSTKQHFLLIDEPELSLSVPWQKRFLLDISKTSRCAGFLAVTHSPFIYDNELGDYAHGINEFMR